MGELPQEAPGPNYGLAAELLLAASGLWPSEPLTPRDADAATKLPKEWAAEISALLSGMPPTKARPAPEVRYLATWKRLNDVEEDDPASAVVSPEIAKAYRDARSNALAYARQGWRPIRVDELQGPRLLEPSTSEQQRASSLLAVVQDPGRIVYGLRAGMISPDALEALRAVYPQIYGLLRRLVAAELLRQRTRRAGYRVPYRAEVVLRTLLGLPSGTPATTINSPAASAPASQVPEINIQRHRQDEQTKADRVADLSP